MQKIKINDDIILNKSQNNYFIMNLLPIFLVDSIIEHFGSLKIIKDPFGVCQFIQIQN